MTWRRFTKTTVLLVGTAAILFACSQRTVTNIDHPAQEEQALGTSSNTATLPHLISVPAKPQKGIVDILNHIEYTDVMKAANYKGIVSVIVMVDEAGQVKRTQIKKSLNKAYDAAVIDAIKAVEWLPAKDSDGHAIKSRFSIDIPITGRPLRLK